MSSIIAERTVSNALKVNDEALEAEMHLLVFVLYFVHI